MRKYDEYAAVDAGFQTTVFPIIARARVTGEDVLHARQHVDFHTLQEHGAANTTSDLAFLAGSWLTAPAPSGAG